MKILLLADICNPLWSSLPGFSYSLAESIANNVDVVLVTSIRNKKGISNKPSPFKEIIYIDNEYIAAPLHRISQFLIKIRIGGWMTGMALKYPSYIVFEYATYKLFKQRLKNKEFDFVHRISPVSPTIPSPIASWSDIPFIYGPLNGALAWPEQFRDEIKKEREVLIHIRNMYKYLPYYKSSFDKAVKILAAFNHLEKDIPKADHHKIIRFNELGVDTELYKPDENKILEAKKICQFLFVGRLVPYKCPHVVISAFANSELLRKHRLNIVGDGPERLMLQNMINNSNLNHCIRIVGWKDQLEVAKYMSDSDVFVFPTIREVGGNVLIEAMSAGLPSIVPNYGGPSELVDDSIGIKIPLSNKADFLAAYIHAMETLASDIQMRNQLSKNAREKALQLHAWPTKGITIKQIYESINVN